jgi:hypothetical protein
MKKPKLVNQRIKWDRAPPFGPREDYWVLQAEGEKRLGIQASMRRPTSLAFLQNKLINPADALDHKTKILLKVRDQYTDAGFATTVVLQDPFTHHGPTTSCTIGFPVNLPSKLRARSLRRFKRFVCRVHVDLVTAVNGNLWSIPHVEPDPIFHWKEHIEFSTIKHLDVRGPVAVAILRYFLSI